MAVKDYFEVKEEQLYMLELFVDRLDLRPEKNVGIACLCVHFEFIDFPPFEISQEEFVSTKKSTEKKTTENNRLKSKSGPLDLNAGKSCLFIRKPRDLLRAMQMKPLKIEVYRVSSQRVPGAASNHDFICKTQIPLSGCPCDQVSMAMNDNEHLPKPYTLKNIYNLTDYLKKPSGTVEITLKLSCFGKSIVTNFALQEKSLLFKSSRFGEEFQCTRVSAENLTKVSEKDKENESSVIGGSKEPKRISLPEPQDVVGLAPACQELINTKDGSANVRPPLRLPTPPPRVSMNEPGFEKLTSAEKLNDRQYRSLVYRAYPNEPTCFCNPADNRAKPFTGQTGCPSTGCAGSCCLKLRRPNAQSKRENVKEITVPCTNPDEYSRKPETNSEQYRVLRMRGGGCEEPNSTGSRGFGFNPVHYDKEYGTTTGSNKLPSSNACKPRGTSAKPGCCCPGKEMASVASKRDANATCTKKPCMGVDCLIQAFKDAQEFVDSLGKVSGLEDLGLADPVTNVSGQRKGAMFPPQVVHTPSSQHGRPSSTQIPRQSIGAAPLPSTFTIAVPGRTGVVREAIPALPEIGSVPSTRSKRKDERAGKQRELETNFSSLPDTDLRASGEPKWSSKKKKISDELTGMAEPRIPTSKKPTSKVRPTSGESSKMSGKGYDRGKQQAKKELSSSGPGGDHNAGAKPRAKGGRRIVKFVYSAGATYPGVQYGHKSCVDPRLRVPANMGWLWNVITMAGKLKPRLGWKPGAISRNLHDLLKEAKAGAVNSRPSSTGSRRKKGKNITSQTSVKKSAEIKKDEEDEETEYPPTLHVYRKDGTYYVTMYPIKDEKVDVPQLPEATKPLQFKITKNKTDASVASSSTASDMEIEFSPPAAVNRYHKKPNVIHVDTQVKQQEILDAFKPPANKKKDKKAKSRKK